MLELLPVELWEYRLRDFGAALISRLRQSPPEENLFLPRLGRVHPRRGRRAEAIVTAIQSHRVKARCACGSAPLLLLGCLQGDRSRWVQASLP